ncbi:hypothetical protein B7P43_G15876 [Cryptotermes secundus]|uniref:C2H2-type domain-containing protein n=1 Tax=Cryptotermes secundus TaxID=105785 RepID=A0A2J7R6T9_9NEOP|nr:uncharacterized protein LOC111863065 [Cryptotermes secundus]PNF36526.1 hypothetical protein B7P43_G15876 [Cryptotermes secundus]PNF36527.1 hypothetical protein B7P43_G15876 [Cryptotermes secundus]
MSYKPYQMNKSEVSLLEHVNAVINLLNSFVVKDNISKDVLRRLDYLYSRLGDFLVQELCNNNESNDSHSWQQAGAELPISKCEELAASLPSNLPEDTPGMEIFRDVQYVCCLCKDCIDIHDFDYKLSVDLHNQTGVHQQVLKLQKMKAAQTAMLETVRPTEINWKHMSPTTARSSIVVCTCQENADKHVTGNSNERGLTEHREAECEMVVTGNGVFYCHVCSVPVGSSSNAIQHKRGKPHQQKLLARQLTLSAEDKLWSKISERWKGHRKYFESLGDAVMKCKVCMVTVPKTEVNVLSHIHGKKHLQILSDSM